MLCSEPLHVLPSHAAVRLTAGQEDYKVLALLHTRVHHRAQETRILRC